MVSCKNWAVIRRYEDMEWIDHSTISTTPELAEMKANEMDQFKPEWGNSNPIVRISQVIIKEL
jgi:hypothetical protein